MEGADGRALVLDEDGLAEIGRELRRLRMAAGLSMMPATMRSARARLAHDSVRFWEHSGSGQLPPAGLRRGHNRHGTPDDLRINR